MCELTRKSKKEVYIGYKVVLIEKEIGKKYSAAMGFCYDDFADEAGLITIPEIKIQNSLSSYFCSSITEIQSIAYSKNMIGRTAIFEQISKAIDLYSDLITQPTSYCFTAAIFKAQISKNIMEGLYFNSPVFAGMQIEFKERISFNV